MRMKNYHHSLKGFILLCGIILGSCAGSNAKFKKEYAKVWKETIKSDAWQASLISSASPGFKEDQNFYSSTEEVVLNTNSNSGINTQFKDVYDKLVSNAYYKIITEAEKSDRKLKEEYQRLTLHKTQGITSKLNKEELLLATKKYEAHNAMLNGLKSWNIMSEYGSDDLEFFQAEHRAKVVAMIEANQSEEEIINYLVYKLADLYHFDQ